MDEQPAIIVKDLHKSFKLPHEQHSGLKQALVNIFNRKRGYTTQKVLKNISFDIKRGEFFGIVGRNGSGKSTLLKLLAGIYVPDQGSVQVNGSLTPFIELGVGFNPELTGRENVFLNGALLGFNRKEMNAMYDDIVAFAELGKFMDQKLKNYSSGMQVRLAFSIAIRAKSDILLIDEVLAVGDAAFQKKCFEHFVQLKKAKKTVILVTHDMAAVERFCDRAMVVHDGTSSGPTNLAKAIVRYNHLNVESPEPRASNRWGTGRVKIERVRISSKGEPKQGRPLELTIETKSPDTTDIVIGLAFIDQFGVNIAGPNSIGVHTTSNKTICYNIDKLPFVAGSYSLTVAVFDRDVVEEYDHLEKAVILNVNSRAKTHGKVDLFGTWSQI